MPTTRRLLGSSQQLALALTAILLAHALVDRWQSAVSTPTIDFFTFWSVPHALQSAGESGIYDEAGQRAMGAALEREAERLPEDESQRRATEVTAGLYDHRVDATGTPLLYMTAGAISSGRYATDQRRFATLSFVCAIAAILLAGHLLGFSIVATALTVFLLLFCHAPLITDFNVGNANAIQLFLVVAYIALTARGRDIPAGVVLGAAVLFKPNLGAIALLSLIAWIADGELRRRWRTIAAAVATGIVCVLASTLYFRRPGVWLEFIASLPKTLGHAGYPLENGNFGPVSLAAYLTGVTIPSWILLAILIAAFGAVVFATRARGGAERGPERERDSTFLIAGIGAATMLLSSPLVWLHYYVLLLPLILFFLRPTDGDAAPNRALARRVTAIATLCVSSLLAQVITEGVLKSQSIEATLFVVTAMALVGLALGELWVARRPNELFIPAIVPAPPVDDPTPRNRKRRRPVSS